MKLNPPVIAYQISKPRGKFHLEARSTAKEVGVVFRTGCNKTYILNSPVDRDDMGQFILLLKEIQMCDKCICVFTDY